MTGTIDIPGLGAIKVTVSEAQLPGIIGMISHGPGFTSVAVCALTDPPVVRAETIRHPPRNDTAPSPPPSERVKP